MASTRGLTFPQPQSLAASQGHNDDSNFFERADSYLRPKTIRNRTAANGAGADVGVVDDSPDFLRLITALQHFYSEKDTMEMQQLDHQIREGVGSGATFQVSTVNAESQKPSEVMADATVRNEYSVILKRSPTILFEENGTTRRDTEAQHAAASFIMEVRILGHAAIRSHPNVVELFGVGWEYARTDNRVPEPNLILEKAYGSLVDFQNKHTNLPLETKRTICLDVAKGLSALHECGVVHGDVKPENILMFESSRRWIAKVSDFSHSLLDTCEEKYLPGGTIPYNAPEWREKLTTKKMFKTDVYSYGILLGCVLVGFDWAQEFVSNLEHGATKEEREEYLLREKQTDRFRSYVIDLLYDRVDTVLAARREDLNATKAVLEHTLQSNPDKRDLQQVITLLSMETKRQIPRLSTDTVISRMDSDILAIPYQPFNGLSDILKRQTVRSLEYVAKDRNDDRSAAACYHLCICYMTGFGVTCNHTTASQWLFEAGSRDYGWAKSAAYHLSKAMGSNNSISATTIENWCIEATSNGSWQALKGLREIGSAQYRVSFSLHRSFLNKSFAESVKTPSSQMSRIPEDDEVEEQWVYISAASGNEAILQREIDHSSNGFRSICEAINVKNENGDTPLMVACRSGQHRMVHRFLDLNANVAATNRYNENCLHLLACLEEGEVESVAERLFDAGADWTAEAQFSSIVGDLDVRLQLPGCPFVRAVIWNKPRILETLFRLETRYISQLSAGEVKIQNSNVRRLIALACRLNYAGILHTIAQNRPEACHSRIISGIGYWIDRRRYSLAALAIAGCVSVRSSTGFDYPEKFWQYLNTGSGEWTDLHATLDFLRSVGVDFVDTACGGERNALFFAVRHGRKDAVEFLLSNTDSADLFLPFGHAHLPYSSSGKSKTTQYQQAKAIPIDGYPNHRQKMGLVDCIILSINWCHKDIFQLLLRWCDYEALDPGIEFVMYESTASVSKAAYDLREFFPWTVHKIRDKQFFSDKRYVFSMRHPLWKSPRHRLLHRLLNLLFTRLFDIRWRRTFSSTLNYGLLYMTLIALAAPREIEFANVLLSEMNAKGITNYYSWVPRNELEVASFPETHTPPLQVAATCGWEELVQLLLRHEAKPRAQWKAPPSPLSRKRPDSVWKLERKSSDSETPYLHQDFFLYQEVGGDHTIIMNLLFDPLKCHEDSRKQHEVWSHCLRAVRLILTAASANDTTTEPLGLKELHKLLEICATSYENPKLAMEAEELWKYTVRQYQQKGMELRRNRSLVSRAVRLDDPLSLKYLLQLGCSSNGRWSEVITRTPMDRVTDSLILNPTESTRESKVRCQKLLHKYGARRGPFYTLEMQLIGSLALYLGIIGTVPATYWSFVLVNRWYLKFFVQMGTKVGSETNTSKKFFLAFGAVFSYLAYLFPSILFLFALTGAMFIILIIPFVITFLIDLCNHEFRHLEFVFGLTSLFIMEDGDVPTAMRLKRIWEVLHGPTFLLLSFFYKQFIRHFKAMKDPTEASRVSTVSPAATTEEPAQSGHQSMPPVNTEMV